MFQTTHKNGLQHKINNILKHMQGMLSRNTDSCIVCGKQQNRNSEMGLCQACTDQIPWINQVNCSVCGRYEACYDCMRRKQTYFICNRSAVRYNSEMKQWLAQYKYRKNERLEPLIVEMLLSAYVMLKRELELKNRKIDYISFIPLSEERLEERGFNQAKRLAQGIAKQTRLPILSALTRTRNTHKQSYKTRAERLKGLEGVFTFNEDVWTERLQVNTSPVNILLVDDVYTTGSTMNQCAKVLSSAMAANVYGLTWAR